LWLQLKRHFTESFAGGLLPQRRVQEGERADELRAQRRRHAYRYILLLLAVILFPVVAHNIYIRQWWPAGGALALLAILIANILLLSSNRDAVLPAPVVMLLSIVLLMCTLYYGQNYNLFLLFPLLVALPILVRTRWAVFLGVLSCVSVAPIVLTEFDHTTAASVGISMVLTRLVSAWLVFVMREQSRRLKNMAITDSLTGVFNRRYLELQSLRCLNDWTRYRRPTTLLLLDIDHFKRINDQFGHAVGDTALTRLVGVLRQRLRRVDILCRFGGEEFAVLLSETAAGRAQYVAEQLRRVVEHSTENLPEGNLTISIGVCDVTGVQDVEHWFKLADAALYRAKRDGRNRVELADTLAEPVISLAKNLPIWR